MANGDKTILYVDKVAIDNYIAQGQYIFNTGVYKSVLLYGTTRYDAIVQDENTIISSSSDWYSCFNTGISISDSTEVVQINNKDYYKLDSYICTTGYTYSSGQKLFFAIGADTMSSYVLAENDFEQTIVEFDYDLNKVTPDYFLWDVTNGVESLKVLYTEPPHKIISEIQYPDETIYDIKDKNALNKSQITNCLLEVPQRIKLEFNNGTLTLKAGSQVIVPNGFEADGTTPKFAMISIASDISFTYTYAPPKNTQCMLFINNTGTSFVYSRTVITCYSGTTKPSGSYKNWYNTTENKMYSIGNNETIDGSGFSFPITIITQGSDGVTKSIDQVFNGMGYIGSTVWVDKGVKGLIPNGRNEDGSLKNIEFETSRVFTNTNTNNLNSVHWVICNGSKIEEWDSVSWIGYNEEKNIIYNKNGSASSKDGNQIACSVIAYMNHDGTELITSFQPKLPFRAVDWNDKSEISGWSLPSTKYIDLTLGASGSTYTAPANGWVQCGCIGTAGSTYFELVSDYVSACASYNGGWGRACIPVYKGMTFSIYYGGTNFTSKIFRFTYAQGEV